MILGRGTGSELNIYVISYFDFPNIEIVELSGDLDT